ncbi:helix-turn-helix domain containing protein [Pantoea sp. B270]|uniref:helix-turn-helix domain-containing protein n=1 Tax=Pantoea sp. B270 TaxID=2836826 RepID=UPI001BFF6430|nr:helix-turn-helix domain-containing protein [Pantoea sp. B270]MBU6517602.1 helix-turn-helix domain containing protein [Pantoea sp. B270]
MRFENAVASGDFERILTSYGFTMLKESSEKRKIGKSKVASWVVRGQVPNNVILQYFVDTGASINWLVAGEYEKVNSICKLFNLSVKPVGLDCNTDEVRRTGKILLTKNHHK